MEPTDLTIEFLKGIRDEIRTTKERVDGLRDELRTTNHATNGRIDALRADTQQGFSELTRRMVESERRTATAITDLAGTVRDMTAVLRTQHDLRPRVEQCERDIVPVVHDRRGRKGRARTEPAAHDPLRGLQ